MPFSSNDSVEILIKARAEGADQIRGMDAASKGLDSSTKALLGTLGKMDSTLSDVGKSIDGLGTKIDALSKKTSQSTKQASSDLEDFAKRLNSIISNPAYSINSPMALAGRAVSQFAQSLGPVGIIATGAAVGVGVLAGGIIDLSVKAGESETALRNFALRLDLPVQAARQLQIEAKLAGVSAQTLEASVRTLSAGLDDPGGAGKRQATALRDLGVATRDLAGNNRDMGEVLVEVYNKLGAYTDKAKQAHDGTVIFGRGFKELIPAIDLHTQLAGKVQDLNNRYAGVNEEFVKSQLVFTEIGIEVDALEKQILLKLIPTLEKAAGWIAKLIPSAKNEIPTPKPFDGFHLTTVAPLTTNDLKVVTDKFLPQFNGAALAAQNVGQAQETTSIDQKYLTPLERLEAQLKRVKEAASELNKGGIVPTEKLGEYNADKQSIANLEARIKALKENTQYQKELANAIQEYGRKAAEAEGGELGTIQKLEAERRSALQFVDFKFKGNTTLKSDVNREFDAKETSEYAKEAARLLTEAAQQQIAALQHKEGIQSKLIDLSSGERKSVQDVTAALERQVTLIEKIRHIELNDPKLKDSANARANTALLDAAANARVQEVQIQNRDARLQQEAERKLREIQDQADNKSFTQSGSFQSRLLETQSRPGDEVATANQIAQIQFDLEQKRLQAELQRAQLENDINKQDEAALKLRLSDEEHIIAIKDEAILRQAEAQRKALEETEAAAGKLFDAFTSKNGGVSKLLQTELHSIEKSLFTNAAGLAFTKTGGNGFGLDKIFPGQRGDDGKLNDFGRLLQGTPFGDKGLKLDANSAPINATAINTQRTADILASLASRIPGTSGPGFGGFGGGSSQTIPGFSFLGSGSESAANPFSFVSGGDTFISATSGFSGSDLVPGGLGITFDQAKSVGLTPADAVKVAQSTGTNPNSFASIAGSAKSFGGALAGGAVNPSGIWNVLSGNSTASTASQIGTGIGAAGVVFGGVEGAIKGFTKGGVGGDASGIASIAGSAAALDPEPISKAVLSGVALVSSIVGSIFGNNQQQRAASISNYIAGSLHTLPNSQGPISQAFDISGSNVVYGSNGGVRATGNVTSPAPVYINAMDAGSFAEFANANSAAIATATNNALTVNHPLMDTIQQRFAS